MGVFMHDAFLVADGLVLETGAIYTIADQLSTVDVCVEDAAGSSLEAIASHPNFGDGIQIIAHEADPN